MKNKTMEMIIKQFIYNYIRKELACNFKLRDCFISKEQITLFGAHVSSCDGLNKIQFTMKNVLIFSGGEAFIMEVYGNINEYGDINDFEVIRSKHLKGGVVYD